ncbi:MAG TPA: phage tail sheath C-terminal domain-containing protein, partial [Bradyrhizobium sp.]|nr:phage tail sheath C-terminal domain-containing protein [Bradyrhizobium sp.]
NGGSQALIVRVHNGATAAKATVPAGGINLIAVNAGAWGNSLRARVDLPNRPPPFAGPSGLFNLSVKDLATGWIEVFNDLSTDSKSEAFVTSVLENQSQLVLVDGPAPANTPPANAAPAAGADRFADPTATSFDGGGDGADITDAQISDSGLRSKNGGLWTLEQADLFNLLCIPPLKRRGGDVGKQSWDAAIAYAKSRRAFVIVDPRESWASANDVLSGVASLVMAGDNAAIYFPRILASDPLTEAVDSFAPGGAIAGIFAETDINRGVWTAPAGTQAVLQGASGLSLGGSMSAGKLTDIDSEKLNPAGINALRNFPTAGTVVWGARTLDGADALASEWKYIPVRRLAFYIEESVFRGTQWAVFEPNAPALWTQITLSADAFMQTLFKQGAFKGQPPDQAYFVRCDSTTTTPADTANGVINIEIGFAPVRPAEFVIISIQQMSNQGS